MRIGAPGWLRQRWGVRAAAALSAAAIVLVALAAAGVALVLLQERAVRAAVEEQVRGHAAAVAGRLAAGEDPAGAVREEGSGFAVVQVLDEAGTVLAASPQLAGAPAMRAVTEEVDEVATVVEDGPLLVVGLETGSPGGDRVVLAGGSLTAAERSTEAATRLALVGVPLLGLVAGLSTYAFTGSALRPVEAIRARVAALTDRDLGSRVPEPAARDEVGRLARTMNDMLGRLEAAQLAQRRFVADASHELRSPLATITARLELGTRRGPTAADLAALLPEAHRMARLIDDLLLLARADERGLAPRRDDVDLDEILEAETARLRAGGTAVRARTVPVRVTGDRGQLARAVRNLAENAARHARSQVTLQLAADAGEAVVRVGDDGPGVPEAQRRRVFERFVRLDDARDRESGGAGLGLAIVAEIVAAHRGRVGLRDAPGGGALFEMRLPAQPAGGAEPAVPSSGSGSRSR